MMRSVRKAIAGVAKVTAALACLAAANAARGGDAADHAIYDAYCHKIDFRLSAAEKKALAPVVAQQLKATDVYHQDRTVELTDSLRYGGWWILLEQDGLSDGAYLFYPGDPRKKTFITTWGGASGVDEGPDNEAWTHANVPGIPEPLARCFSRFVISHPTG